MLGGYPRRVQGDRPLAGAACCRQCLRPGAGGKGMPRQIVQVLAGIGTVQERDGVGHLAMQPAPLPIE
ncbi:hypothetical protein D3C83_162810 [compost metagenome]